MVRRDASFVAEGDLYLAPLDALPEVSELFIHLAWRGSSGKTEPEKASLGDGLVMPFKDESDGSADEIRCSQPSLMAV